MALQYPLSMSFKIIAISRQIFVKDAAEQSLFYIKAKPFKMKEDIGVFTDQSQANQLFRIQADRIIDFSARYNFTDTRTNQPVGSIKRKGLASLFKSEYIIAGADGRETHMLTEDNAMIKFLDALVGEIPIVGMFAGYFLNPSYTLYTFNPSGNKPGEGTPGTPLLHLKKQPAFFEGKFTVERAAGGGGFGDEEETKLILSIMMATLLERARG